MVCFFRVEVLLRSSCRFLSATVPGWGRVLFAGVGSFLGWVTMTRFGLWVGKSVCVNWFVYCGMCWFCLILFVGVEAWKRGWVIAERSVCASSIELSCVSCVCVGSRSVPCVGVWCCCWCM